MKQKILLLFFLLSIISCGSYSEYFFIDNFKNNYHIKLLKNNNSVIYLTEDNKKIDSTVMLYKKATMKLNLSKLKFNSFTQSNKYVRTVKKVKTISFSKDSSNNLHFKFFENTRFALVDRNLSTIDSIWLKNGDK